MGCITLGNRQMMIQAMKTIMVPYLRAHGFKGSYPHFRRKQDSFQEILMIYITKYSEDFYMETSIVPLTGYVDFEGDTILPNKVKVSDLKAEERFIVGADLVETPDGDGKSFVMNGLTTKQEHEDLAKDALTYLNIEDPSWMKRTVAWQRALYRSFDEEKE
ncbi:DUF4304 domain-containing protein [uncultured Exiguobacterium sp.]|uniref:DUF4304 domain-containing protein n=1 Tax=uncultured Exiguobacterium sp. TaxID=202669 RepID=UPI0025E848CD|nr:DUF4304 domain-containing protein [uncultured Exiguobacterium sp.]